MSRELKVDIKVKENYNVIDKYENITPNEARDILDSKYTIKEKKSKIDLLAEAMETQFKQGGFYQKFNKNK